MYVLPKGPFNKKQLEEALDHAIAIELTTIPCYLYTYYSIQRRLDQDALYQKIMGQVKDDKLAKELTMNILLYSNKAAGTIMSVVVEEMLHLSLSSNVRQAIYGPPDLLKTGKNLNYPATLFEDSSEFKINLGPLSIDELIVFLKIESPNDFEEDPTIGEFYNKIISSIKEDFPGEYTNNRPQLVPSQPYYSQNSINTVYYDKKHNPQFPSNEKSGGMIEVKQGVPSDPKQNNSAFEALEEIIEQGEGNKAGAQLEFENGRPIPLPVNDKGEVEFRPDDYDSPGELTHFAKFMELYSLGLYYEDIFASHKGLDKFFDYFVYDQAVNPVSKDFYPDTSELYQKNELANAIYTYILLMIETCYYQHLPTQFEVFMMGIHKSMIWLLSELGNRMYSNSFFKDGQSYQGGLTFEYYPFEVQKDVRPKQQIINLARKLTDTDPDTWGWLFTMPQYMLNLPDVGLDHDVKSGPML